MRNNSHILLLLCFIVLILMSVAPRGYDFGFILAYFFISIVGVLFYLKKRHYYYKNYLDFEPLFIVTSLVMCFTAPLFVLPNDVSLSYVFSWGLPFSQSYFNKCAGLSALGILAFMFGSLKQMRIPPKQSKVFPYKIINSRPIFIFLIILIILYSAYSGFSYYSNIYHHEAQQRTFVGYFEYFIIAASQLLSINEIWNKVHCKSYKINLSYIFTVALLSVLFFIVGSRTKGLYICLPFIIGYAKEFRNVSFMEFVLAISIGFVLMVAILFFRSGYDTSLEYDWYHYFTDLCLSNNNSYYACEIVEKSGYSYGLSMMSALLTIVPFGNSFFQSVFGLGEDVLNSAVVFHNFLGSEPGPGTNFIADSYLAFGGAGVVVISCIIGSFLESSKNRAYDSYYRCICYYILCGFSIYMVRASFIFSFRFIIYGIILAAINLALVPKSHNL